MPLTNLIIIEIGRCRSLNCKKFLPFLISVAVAVAMTALAGVFHEREIIFPEITAIAIGSLTAESMPWNTTKIRLLLTISTAAVCGVLIVRFLDIPLFPQILAALFCAFLIITISATEFMPAISACVLPVILHSHSIIYVLSVIIFTSTILLCRLLLEKLAIRNSVTFSPINLSRELLLTNILRFAIIAAICLVPALLHKVFFIVPPLIVAFTEMCKPDSPLVKRVFSVSALIAAAAVISCTSRLLLTEILGLPLFMPTAVSTATVLFIAYKLSLPFPPCGAVATLPMLIDASSLTVYPYQVFAGFIVFTAAALLAQPLLKKIASQKYPETSSIYTDSITADTPEI